MTVNEKWFKTISWLRSKFHPLHPVTVRSKVIKCGFWGYSTFVNTQAHPRGQYKIVIDRRTSWGVVRETLLHEWAHCMAGFTGEDEYKDHGAAWGKAYALVYREFIRWDYGRPKPKPKRKRKRRRK